MLSVEPVRGCCCGRRCSHSTPISIPARQPALMPSIAKENPTALLAPLIPSLQHLTASVKFPSFQGCDACPANTATTGSSGKTIACPPAALRKSPEDHQTPVFNNDNENKFHSPRLSNLEHPTILRIPRRANGSATATGARMMINVLWMAVRGHSSCGGLIIA